MTPAVATIQLGYSTDREALSSMTMGAACHNTDALTGGTAGMPQPCLQAAGMESDRKTGVYRGERVHTLSTAPSERITSNNNEKHIYK